MIKSGLALASLMALLSSRVLATNVIPFKDRAIDLDLDLQGYPYTNPIVREETAGTSGQAARRSYRCKPQPSPRGD